MGCNTTILERLPTDVARTHKLAARMTQIKNRPGLGPLLNKQTYTTNLHLAQL
jgi:hypothetical protein